MKKELFSDAMEFLDEDLLSAAHAARGSHKNRKLPGRAGRTGRLTSWLRYATVAACLLLTVGILTGLWQIQRWTEPFEEAEVTGPLSTTVPPSFEIPVWNDHIWDSGTWEQTSYSKQGFLKTGTNRLRMMLRLKAHYGDYTPSPEEESLMTLWGEWKTTALNADYEKHFALYPDEVVEHCFTSTVLVQGMTYEAAMERIYGVSERIWPFTDCELDYQLLEIGEATQGEQVRLTSSLSSLGLKPEKVGRVTCMRFSYTVRLSFDDYRMEESREEGMLFYCYDGNWYPAPWTVSDGLCFELLSEDLETTGYLSEHSVQIHEVEFFVDGILKEKGKNDLYYASGQMGDCSFPGNNALLICYSGYDLKVTDSSGESYRLYFISKMPR